MKMKGDETNCWDGTGPNDAEILKTGEWHDFTNILDFPMESLGEDGSAGDWDIISMSHCLGPIPSEGFLDFSPVSNVNRSAPSTVTLSGDIPIGGTGEPPSRSFQAHSPVSVLESSGSCSGEKWLPIKSNIKVPGRTRSRRARRTSLNPWFVMSPSFSADSASTKISSSRKNKEKKKKLSRLPLTMKIKDASFQLAEELLDALESTKKKETSLQRSVPTKKCTHCEVTKTPQWREGPNGPKTLCNACGVRYRSGRLFPEYRPAASPTFVPLLHSNSHKKVIEMRKKALQEIATSHDPTMSPPPEFVPTDGSMFDFIH